MGATSVPALLRHQVSRWAHAWLTAKFSRLLELRAQDPGPFNYPIAVFSEWRGKAFYLDVRYRARSRRPEDDFVVRHTQMTLIGFGRFDLGRRAPACSGCLVLLLAPPAGHAGERLTAR